MSKVLHKPTLTLFVKTLFLFWRKKNFLEREFPSQWGGAKVNINVSNKIEMSEALNTVAGELLDQIASS